MKISSVTSRPPSVSITQSITGRPATLSIGLGTRWVCGRRRVPLPASGMMTCTSAPSVAVGQANQVVELRGGGLQHVTVHDGFDLMDQPRRNVHRLSRAEASLHQGGGATLP